MEKLMLSLLNVFLLCSVCEAQLSDVLQPVSFQSAALGEAVSITCHISSSVRHRVWYKVTTTRRLQIVATTDTFYNLTIFGSQFRQRYAIKYDSTSNHLSISATTWEDVGTYYCGAMRINDMLIAEGTFLMLKGAKMISDSVIQKPESESVQPGRSVALSCSVHTDRCAAEHTHVLWLKNSDHSAPEMIHSSGNKNDTCQKTETGSGEATCVYHLLMRNLSSDDAGTYYCAVTSCGEVLLGKGTRIKMNIMSTDGNDSPALVYIVSGALAFTTILVVLLALTVCMMIRNCQRTDSVTSAQNVEVNQDADNLHYAAIRDRKANRPRRQQDNTMTECVYSSVKQQN
ncbi:signal-regulatory protein beta-2-like [Scomber japonicus]|uniref:signal-regulatory protein beta-2-like n=1 Tax=Scomber japonicus TaxID=13676 RepID=UPI00230574AB|nr:signal-regulatory protein beta-2-like [Scomber japonicus]